MPQKTKTNLPAKKKEFVLMGRTRALLGEVWDHWLDNVGHTPEVAERMMSAAIKELHKTEVKTVTKAKTLKGKAIKAGKKAVAKKVVKAVKTKVSKKTK